MDMIRITASHFVAGIVLDNIHLRVVKPAPILNYMLHWKLGKILNYCKSKGWKCEYYFNDSKKWKDFTNPDTLF